MRQRESVELDGLCPLELVEQDFGDIGESDHMQVGSVSGTLEERFWGGATGAPPNRSLRYGEARVDRTVQVYVGVPQVLAGLREGGGEGTRVRGRGHSEQTSHAMVS